MKRSDITLLTWFFFLGGFFLAREWWFEIPLLSRIVAVLAALFGSFAVLMGHHLKSAGRSMIADGLDDTLLESEQKVLTGILRADKIFKRTLIIFMIGGLALVLAFVTAIPTIKEANSLFVYIIGWAVWCLLLDFQIRLHLMCVLLRRILSRTDPSVQDRIDEKASIGGKAA